MQGDSVHTLRLVVEWALALSQSHLVCRCYTFSLQLTTLTGGGTTQAIPYQWPKLTLSIRIDFEGPETWGIPKWMLHQPFIFKMNNGSCMTLLYIHKKIYIHIYVYRFRYYISHIHLVHRNDYIISSSSSKICQTNFSLGSSTQNFNMNSFFGSLSLKGISEYQHPDTKKTQRYIQKPAR